MILFHLQKLGAGRHIPSYFQFLNNKIVKNIFKNLLKMLHFFICVVFFYWKEIENARTTNVSV